ncbi:hypothetical protein GCM10010214_24990 [Streptomyces abikoensis]|nr:hypothetical protein GCM10010214_24990 [Streptomyces abikoensis]
MVRALRGVTFGLGGLGGAGREPRGAYPPPGSGPGVDAPALCDSGNLNGGGTRTVIRAAKKSGRRHHLIERVTRTPIRTVKSPGAIGFSRGNAADHLGVNVMTEGCR